MAEVRCKAYKRKHTFRNKSNSAASGDMPASLLSADQAALADVWDRKTPAGYRNWEWSSWRSPPVASAAYETVSEKDPLSFISPYVIWGTRGEVIFRIIIFKDLPQCYLGLNTYSFFFHQN